MLLLENSKRKDTAVTIEDCGGPVTGSIIENQDLVVTAEFVHHLADLPKKNPDGSLFIVRRNADVDQWSMLSEGRKAVEGVQWAALRMPRPQLLGGATTP